MKCGINGAEHDFNEIPCGINGAVRQASELWIGVNGAVKKVWPTFPIGTKIVLDTVGSGTWTCPASGEWEVELHGGGGSGGPGLNYYKGAGGGGSGSVFTISFEKGASFEYTIGAGASSPHKDGESTQIAQLSVDGARSASYYRGGAGAGNLGTAGRDGDTNIIGTGGYGNRNKPEQPYGNGGNGGPVQGTQKPGKDGAIILTYLG